MGSVSGSLANGVSRFSRLLPAQVNCDPELLTMVPRVGLASTFDHGSGVSRSPSRTTTYSRPSGVNPPSPFFMTSAGSDTDAPLLSGVRSSADGGTSSSSNCHGAGRSSWGTRSPRSPGKTTRATAASRRRSTSAMPSARSSVMPPGLPSHPAHRSSCSICVSSCCTSSR